MVTAALLWLFRTVLDGLDVLLPSWSPPDISGTLATALGSIGDVGEFVGGLNWYFPVRETVEAVVILFAAWTAGLLYRGVVWVLTKAHILGGQ
jgi:hypothetical protein